MKKFYFHESAANYHKALARLEKNIRSGQFAKYSQQKKQEIWRRICRYAQQLGIKLKASVAAACIAAGLCLSIPASAQISFTPRTGTSNPFNSITTGHYAQPTFVDIDGDGDQDAFVGEYNGTAHYFKNTGTAAAPLYIEQTGAANPLNIAAVGYGSSPTFVDIDGDGDLDAFVGSFYGTVTYYKNTGTSAAPVFALQSGSNNPLNGQLVPYYTTLAFVDIDGDGDQDVFIGSYDGSVIYYKNTGTASTPLFSLQSGAGNNPLNGVDVGKYCTIAFADLDKDGDQDVLLGSGSGALFYYKNTGSATAPVFTPQTGANNPFDAVNEGYTSAPAFVDIDGDGDKDLFIGVTAGTVAYYENTSSLLPLHLISFNGIKQAGYNQLQWQTADESNTKLFEIERSSDGKNFTKVATLNSAGTGNSSYSIHDDVVYSGKIFYRLKIIDRDGRFSYSQIIWLNSNTDGKIIIYPNPAMDLININIGSTGILKTKAGIFDVNGRLMQNVLINADQQQIDVHTLAKGAYLIKFADGSSQSFIKR